MMTGGIYLIMGFTVRSGVSGLIVDYSGSPLKYFLFSHVKCFVLFKKKMHLLEFFKNYILKQKILDNCICTTRLSKKKAVMSHFHSHVYIY